MANLADIISQKKEDSDSDNNSFEDDDGFDSETPQQSQSVQPLSKPSESITRPELTPTPSSSSSIPIIPSSRPTKKSSASLESPAPQPSIPKRPIRSQSPVIPTRSESPIIPPRPKKSSTPSASASLPSNEELSPKNNTEKTVPEMIKSTIEQIPGVGNLVGNTSDDIKQENPIIPKHPSSETKVEEPIIPPRPKKSSSEEPQEHSAADVKTPIPMIPKRPTRTKELDSGAQAEEIKEGNNESSPVESSESSAKGELIVNDETRDVPVISNDKTSADAIEEKPIDEIKKEIKEKKSPKEDLTDEMQENVSSDISIGPKGEIVKKEESLSKEVNTEAEAFDAKPVDNEEFKEIKTEADIVEHAHDPVKDDGENENITTEADAVEKLEEKTKDVKEESPFPKIPQRPTKRPTRTSTPSLKELGPSEDPKKDVELEESTDDIISKTNEELQTIQAHFEKKTTGSNSSRSSTPSIPPRPPKKTSTSSSSDIIGVYASDSQEDSKPKPTGKSSKPPPPVPKKPSSKIAAFQEMLKRNQEQERQQQQQQQQVQSRSERSDSNDSVGRSKFKQNLNGLFALPGMTRPGMPMPGMFKEEDRDTGIEDEGEQEPTEVKSDARRSRAKGPRGKRTTKVEKIEIPDHRVIKVIDVWSSGGLNSKADIVYDNEKDFQESETGKSEGVITDDIDDIELINPGEKQQVHGAEKQKDVVTPTPEDDLAGFEKDLQNETETEVEEPLKNESTERLSPPTVVTTDDSVPQEDKLNIAEASKDISKEDKGYESDNEDIIKEYEEGEDNDRNPSIQSIKSKNEENVPDASIRSLKSENFEPNNDKYDQNDEEKALSTPELIDEYVDAEE